MTKVLVAYDGSVMSKAALQEAKDLVELKPDTEVHVVSVITLSGPIMNFEIAKMITEELAGPMRSDMKQLKKELEDEGIHPQCEVIVDENQQNPGIAVCRYAEEKDIDLIIVGSRGLGAVKRFLLGSVSHYIVQNAKCKVLIIK